MEKNIGTMESQKKLHYDDVDGGDDDDDKENFACLSSEELAVKINSFRHLCNGNKLNTNNAFDIDMIGHFSYWLKKKKEKGNEDVKLFQEIGDYLDTSGKLYSYRVDNLSETTCKLIEQFRAVNYKQSILNEDNENEPQKLLKPKRLKLMLTTSDKLNYKPSAIIDSEDSKNKQEHFKFDFNKLFSSTSRPANYMLSLFSNTPLSEEVKISNVKNIQNNNQNKHSMGNIENEITKRVLCPEFKNFIANRDKIIDSEESLLDGIEDRFDVNDHPYMDLMSNPDNDAGNDDKLSSIDMSKNEELLDCIDEVNRDYSFFNPVLLANWKGPKLWKTQAMVKALKSTNPSEQNDLFDELSQGTFIEPKTRKRCNKVNKIKWLTMSEIDTYLNKNIVCKEQLAPKTLKNWSTLANLSDTQSIVVDIKHKLTFLEYIEVKPDWWTQDDNTDNKSESMIQSPISSLNNEEVNDYHETFKNNEAFDDTICKNTDEIKTENREHIDINKLNKSYPEEDDTSDDNNFKTESKMDIGELKKEILTIIEQECVITDSKSEWSSRLSFINLLSKLRLIEREELSIAIIFVGLLHLTNEHGFKLIEEYSTITNLNEMYIVRPMKKLM